MGIYKGERMFKGIKSSVKNSKNVYAICLEDKVLQMFPEKFQMEEERAL